MDSVYITPTPSYLTEDITSICQTICYMKIIQTAQKKEIIGAHIVDHNTRIAVRIGLPVIKVEHILEMA